MRKQIQAWIMATLLGALLLVLPLSAAVATEITVAAANSTCATLAKAAEIFTREQGVTIQYICKSSGLLAEGLATGYISADYFIAASEKWLNYLVSRGIIGPATVKPLWDNRIIAAASNDSALGLQSWDELATAKVSTIFVGDPSTTPLGRQFKNAMVARGLWLSIRSKIVTKGHLSETVKALGAGDDTSIGIIFPSSLGGQLKPVLNLPPEWHEAIRYYGGPLLATKHKEETALFESFLKSGVVNELFRQKGYLLVP